MDQQEHKSGTPLIQAINTAHRIALNQMITKIKEDIKEIESEFERELSAKRAALAILINTRDGQHAGTSSTLHVVSATYQL